MNYSCYAKQIISRHLNDFSSELKKFEDTKDAERLHKARVAGRRLRNALWVFKKFFSDKKRKSWAESIQHLSKETGKLRDLDGRVGFGDSISKKAKSPALKSQLDRMIEVLKRKRENLFMRTVKAIKIFQSEDTLGDLGGTLQTLSKRMGGKGRDRLYYFSHKKIVPRLMEFLSFEPYVRKPRSIRELHQMRIAAKKLRYTLECFDPFYNGRMNGFIRKVQLFQDVLGRIHDLDVWIKTTVEEIPEEERKDFEKFVVYFLKICKDERNKAFRGFVGLWDETVKQRTFVALIKEVSFRNNKAAPSIRT